MDKKILKLFRTKPINNSCMTVLIAAIIIRFVRPNFKNREINASATTNTAAIDKSKGDNEMTFMLSPLLFHCFQF